MKTKLFILFGLTTLIFTACKLNSESNYVPEIWFVSDPIVNGTDTLSRYYTDTSGEYRLDTIMVGDTVSFKMYFTGYSNNLTAFYLTESADSATKILLPRLSSLDSMFLSTSNYEQGKFFLKGAFSSFYFPFKYVARKPSKEAKIIFSVVSDANFKDNSASNSSSFVLKTPIVTAPEIIKRPNSKVSRKIK